MCLKLYIPENSQVFARLLFRPTSANSNLSILSDCSFRLHYPHHRRGFYECMKQATNALFPPRYKTKKGSRAFRFSPSALDAKRNHNRWSPGRRGHRSEKRSSLTIYGAIVHISWHICLASAGIVFGLNTQPKSTRSSPSRRSLVNSEMFWRSAWGRGIVGHRPHGFAAYCWRVWCWCSRCRSLRVANWLEFGVALKNK